LRCIDIEAVCILPQIRGAIHGGEGNHAKSTVSGGGLHADLNEFGGPDKAPVRRSRA
jgi:hypothetical protein